jgi:predicted RecA/RadA family phage recombinase
MSAINIAANVTTAIQANFSIYKGEDVAITDSLSPVTNITGWSLQFTLRKNYGDTSAILTKTIGAGITVTDVTNGVFKIALANADTANLAPGVYVYDVERTDAGNRTVLTIGYLNILPEVY